MGLLSNVVVFAHLSLVGAPSHCVTPSFTNITITLKHEQLRDIVEDIYLVSYAIRLLLIIMTCVLCPILFSTSSPLPDRVKTEIYCW